MISSLVFNRPHRHWVALFYLICSSSLLLDQKSHPLVVFFTLAKGVWFGELFTSYRKIWILEFMGKGRPKNVWSMIIFIFIEQITFSSCALYWWLRICKNRESKELLTFKCSPDLYQALSCSFCLLVAFHAAFLRKTFSVYLQMTYL